MKIISYRYLPLNVYIVYSVFVLFSLLVGPMEYQGLDYLVLFSFVFVALLLFIIGFLAGARGDYRKHLDLLKERLFAYRRVERLVQGLLLLSVTAALLQWYFFVSAGVGVGFDSIGENYVAGYQGYERGQASIDIMYVLNIFEQSLTLVVLLFCFYYFSVMGRFSRFAFIFVVVTYLLVNVLAAGKQKYLGDVVVLTLFCMVVNFAARGSRIKVSAVLAGIGLGCFVFLMFVEILRQRYQAAGINVGNIYEKVHPLIVWNDNAWVLSVVSSDYALALGIFLGYFTNGLYGLYLSLTLPFEWTYFVGNSYSLGRIVEILFSADGSVLEHTYPYRVGLAYGWGFDKWHSLFSWLASDITFLGVLLLTPIFSFFYARIWLQAVRANNPFSGPLFIYFSMGLVFSYANNQIMHGLAGVLVLLVLFVGWCASRNTGGGPRASEIELKRPYDEVAN
ncbi:MULTISPECIES: hypothetical protein [unclassified Pseudomonas]|uniref:hypothetical protein n=1 Tax=unclassified Pseudomonas TaxID=196821 RepID=UPI002097E170|nr:MULTISPECIES: hypothetical protein [unclassified Pseudomonas]MCO7506514.1 hypothetical protein [Pseudomonas sp. VE 267-6A]MCO7531781.1 hypothetical protein [Pseudomonas sp. 2]